MINKIKDKLYNNWDELENILNKLNCTKIHRESGKYIKFGLDENSSGEANVLKPNTLSCCCYNEGTKGDIITFVAKRKFNDNLGQAVKWLGNELGIKNDYKPRVIHPPFGGFWKNLESTKSLDLSPPLTYPMSRYTKYTPCCSKLWIKDNISCQTQEKFDIRYNDIDNRILIPWTWFNELAGIVGRINKSKMTEKDKKYKYLSEIPFNKEKVLFGYDINYKDLLESGIGFVFESEKSTMQLYDMDMNNGLSIGSSTIADQQAKLMKGLFIDWVVAFDSDHTYEECEEQAKKLIMDNPFFRNDVYILYDEEHKYMKPEDKTSPTDLGQETFMNLVKECLHKIT